MCVRYGAEKREGQEKREVGSALGVEGVLGGGEGLTQEQLRGAGEGGVSETDRLLTRGPAHLQISLIFLLILKSL